MEELGTPIEADEVEMSAVFSAPSLPDNPMIYVSEQSKMQTGYLAKEAVGKNCRFLQGSDTKPHSMEATSDVHSPGCLTF